MFQGVFKTKGFQEMSDTALAKVLQSDNLMIDEPDILNAVKDWAAINSVSLEQPNKRLFLWCVIYLLQLPFDVKRLVL